MRARDDRHRSRFSDEVERVRKSTQHDATDLPVDHGKLGRLPLDGSQPHANRTHEFAAQAGGPSFVSVDGRLKLLRSLRLNEQARRHPPR